MSAPQSSSSGTEPAIWKAISASIKERMDNCDGFWRSCSGCYEMEDGQNVHGYPHSNVFGCILGGGCSECGGIGAIWDTTDYGAMADDILAADARGMSDLLATIDAIISDNVYADNDGIAGISAAAEAIVAALPRSDGVAQEAVDRDRLRWMEQALQTIAHFPVTDPKNLDAANMQIIALGVVDADASPPAALPAGEAEGIQWRRVNDEPFEYAIQKGFFGDEFVHLVSGGCLRRSLPIPSTPRATPIDHSDEECPNFPGCHCVEHCCDGWKHPSPELSSTEGK